MYHGIIYCDTGVHTAPSSDLAYLQYANQTTSTCCSHIGGLHRGVQKAFHTPQNENQSRSGSESAILLHKLKTQLSALLQDKQPQARYAAVVFIKAAVQVGGSNVLQGAAPWVRNLIGIMRVSDSSAGQACQTSSISVLSDRVKLFNLPIYCLCIPLLTYECRDRIL